MKKSEMNINDYEEEVIGGKSICICDKCIQ